MAQIDIKIRPDGKIEAETFGIKGKKCIDYLKIIEKLTNAKVYDSDYTSEYFEVDSELENNVANNVTEEI